MADKLKTLLTNIVPEVLANLLRDGLGFDGVASECPSSPEWSSGVPTRGEILLVGEAVILQLSTLVEPDFADRLLRSFVGGSDTIIFEDDERQDAVAEVANMLAGRLSEAMRASGIDVSIVHPKGKNAQALGERARNFTQSETWQWASANREIVLTIAYQLEI